MVQDARTKLTNARAQLILDAPFFGTLALRLQPQPDDRPHATMSTDGRTLKYSPDFILDTPNDELKTVLAHEVMHVALCHHTRMQNRDHKVWNKAADYAVNQILIDAGFKMPSGALVDAAYSGKSAEEIYSELSNQPDPDGNNQGPGAGQQGSDQNQGPQPGDQPGGIEPAPADVDPKQEEADQKVAMVQAQAAAQVRGNMPGNVDRLVTEIVHPRQDWKHLLRDFVERAARNDYNWNVPNKRYLGRGFILPTLVSDELRPIVVVLDMSGSISAQQAAEFAGELTSILETWNTTIHTLYVDTVVRKAEAFTRDDLPLRIDVQAGGGTDFRPAFEHVDAEDIQPAALVYFTDLDGTFPDQAPEYPVLWINHGRIDQAAPFGETVKQ